MWFRILFAKRKNISMIWTMKCKYATTDFKECTPEEMPKRGEGVTGKTVSDLESGGVADLPENEGRGFEFVKFAEACGAAWDGDLETIKNI